VSPRRRIAFLVLFLAAAVLFVWYQGRTVVPEGQPPLVTLDASAMLALRSDFNRHADATRLIILLSPT
jgi:hypothetical protein